MEILNKQTGDTRFHHVVRQGFQKTFEFCESGEFDPRALEVSNDLKQRPIHLAVAARCPELLSYLLQKGAQVDSFKKGDWTALMASCALAAPEAPKLAQLLLKGGAEPRLRNKDGWTALHIASRTGRADTVQVLIRDCPELVLTPSRNGRLPIHIAALNGHEAVVKLLLEVGGTATCELRDACGSTPLLDAATGGCVDVLNLLVGLTHPETHRDGRGLGCLHKAAAAGHVNALEMLLRLGSFDVDAETQDGFTALMFAVMEKQAATASLLLKHGAKTESSRKSVFSLTRGMSPVELNNVIKESATTLNN